MIPAIVKHPKVFAATLGTRTTCYINVGISDSVVVSVTIKANEMRYLVCKAMKLILGFRTDATIHSNVYVLWRNAWGSFNPCNDFISHDILRRIHASST